MLIQLIMFYINLYNSDYKIVAYLWETKSFHATYKRLLSFKSLIYLKTIITTTPEIQLYAQPYNILASRGEGNSCHSLAG